MQQQLFYAQFNPFQNSGGAETEYDMNALAKRFNSETRNKLELAGLGKHKTFVTRRQHTGEYLPILN